MGHGDVISYQCVHGCNLRRPPWTGTDGNSQPNCVEYRVLRSSDCSTKDSSNHNELPLVVAKDRMQQRFEQLWWQLSHALGG